MLLMIISNQKFDTRFAALCISNNMIYICNICDFKVGSDDVISEIKILSQRSLHPNTIYSSYVGD